MSRALLKLAWRPSSGKTLCSDGFGGNAPVGVLLCLDRTECRLQGRQLLVSLQPPKPLGGFLHGRPGPVERHRGIPPVRLVAAYAPDCAHHVLDDVGSGQGTAELRGQLQAHHSQDFADPLEDGLGHAGRLLLQSTRKIAEQLFRLPHIIQFPGLAERSPDRGVQVFRQSLQDVAALVDLAALDRCVRETADFETPSPLPVGMSPSGRRTAQAKRRVETLIGIRFIAQRASRSSDWATSHLGTSISRPPRPRTRGRSSETLPPWKPILPWVLPQRWPGLPSR